MSIEENKDNSLLSGQEPHQKEEMDQAARASTGSFTLEPEKGITPDPDEYNKGAEQGNLKQIDNQEPDGDATPGIDPVSELDLDADDTTVTEDDLRNLDGENSNEESTM